MSFANVLLYAALLVVMVYRRLQGRPVGTTKQLFLLPALVTFLGFEDLSHAKLGTVDIAVGVAGCGLSLLLGALRGTQNKLSQRDGTPWVRWGAASVAIFAFNVVVKLALDVAGVALGGSTSGVTASLVLAVGLMLAGEAVVVWFRLQAGDPLSTDRDTMTAGNVDLTRSPQPWSQARSSCETLGGPRATSNRK
jgi:hypothetical protein